MRDIGYHFPDNSEEFKNISSLILLEKTIVLLSEEGYSVGNIDATICAQKPKLSGFIPEMQKAMAEKMAVETGQVSIKATTTEQLGFEGRSEGISVHAVALIEKK